MILSIDFETRSTVDLRTAGVYVYAAHHTTDVWCMAWAIGDADVQVWLPGQTLPAEFVSAVRDDETELRAWNASFERTVWHAICVPRYGFPEVPLGRWHCTAAEAAAMALPRALADAANVTGVNVQKDAEGHRLMLRMARPRSKKGVTPIVWWSLPERIKRLSEYCATDVRVERALYRVLRRLSPKEREVYLLDQRMNDRGVMLDVPLVKAAKRIVNTGVARANDDLKNITGGAVTAVTKVADMKAWLNHAAGLNVDSIRKSIIEELLGGDTIPPEARRVLEIRQEVGRSSVAKLNAMLRTASLDDRVRGLLLYHGASTGRWTGRLIQVQNLPRGNVSNVESFIPAILSGDYDFMDLAYPPLIVVSSLLRGMLRATSGHRFMVGDFAQIEARVLAWLAGQKNMLEVFVGGGQPYHEAAANVYKVPVSGIEKGTPEYQLGKALVLGCGYQMGAETFRNNCLEMWGLEISEELSETAVDAYRKNNNAIVDLWWKLQYAVMNAVSKPGTVEMIQGCKLTKRGGYLWIVLPSGRPLAYPSPTIEPRLTPWGEVKDSVMTWAVNSYNRKWEKRALYGGLLTENIVQALSRDLMVEALLRVEKEGYDPIFSVHDEVVVEASNGHGSLSEFTHIMGITPGWAEGLPIGVDAWEGDRYGKG